MKTQNQKTKLTSSPSINNIPLTVAEFFSGIGGTRLAVEQVGFEVVASSEIDKSAIQTYQDNFGDTPLGDINKINPSKLPDFTVLAASTPCQSFSLQGNRRGLNDNRGQLIQRVFDTIDIKKPIVVFIENVKGMASANNGHALKYILKQLKLRGYFTHWQVLRASEFGVPQNRERLFIVAFKKNVPFSFPNPTKLNVTSSSILETKVAEEFYLTQSEVDTQVRAKERYEKKGSNFSFQLLDKAGSAKTILAAQSSLYKNLVPVELDKNAPSTRGTFKCEKSGKLVHLRKLTPREYARLQGFPESYKLTSSSAQTYKQLGNSVPVPVIREIYKEILVSLSLWGHEAVATGKNSKQVNPKPPKKKKLKKAKPEAKKDSANKPQLSLIRSSTEPVTPEVYPQSRPTYSPKVMKEIEKWHAQDKANHFMTPLWLTRFLNFVCPIELDAASSESANSIHGFPRFFSKEDNSLTTSWKVRKGCSVFVNPPYTGASTLLDWSNKSVSEFKKNGQTIFLLVPARSPESQWFTKLLQNATHVVFCKKRLNHNEIITKQVGSFASAIVVLGGDLLGEKINLLSQLGECMETSSYRLSKEKKASTIGGAA
jgi:DNA (cytosine-5)-methyltransferase 1